jgi:hypothetical protein
VIWRVFLTDLMRRRMSRVDAIAEFSIFDSRFSISIRVAAAIENRESKIQN